MEGQARLGQFMGPQQAAGQDFTVRSLTCKLCSRLNVLRASQVFQELMQKVGQDLQGALQAAAERYGASFAEARRFFPDGFWADIDPKHDQQDTYLIMGEHECGFAGGSPAGEWPSKSSASPRNCGPGLQTLRTSYSRMQVTRSQKGLVCLVVINPSHQTR